MRCVVAAAAGRFRKRVATHGQLDPDERTLAVEIAGSGPVGTIALEEAIVARVARFCGPALLRLGDCASPRVTPASRGRLLLPALVLAAERIAASDPPRDPVRAKARELPPPYTCLCIKQVSGTGSYCPWSSKAAMSSARLVTAARHPCVSASRTPVLERRTSGRRVSPSAATCRGTPRRSDDVAARCPGRRARGTR
jgi:hypothetical protein